MLADFSDMLEFVEVDMLHPVHNRQIGPMPEVESPLPGDDIAVELLHLKRCVCM